MSVQLSGIAENTKVCLICRGEYAALGKDTGPTAQQRAGVPCIVMVVNIRRRRAPVAQLNFGKGLSEKKNIRALFPDFDSQQRRCEFFLFSATVEDGSGLIPPSCLLFSVLFLMIKPV